MSRKCFQNGEEGNEERVRESALWTKQRTW